MTGSTQTACKAKMYQVSKSELPLSCPTQDMDLTSGHPRVYLAIEKTGSATCPYCGAKFILRDKK